MISKLKICCKCQKEKIIFSKRMCKSCWVVNYQKPLKRGTFSSTITKSQKKIPKISKNQKKRLEKYQKLRNEYLKEHSICEVCNNKPSSEIHHRKGREGNNLFQYFLAVDQECHQYIELNPEEAKEKGWSLSRMKND